MKRLDPHTVVFKGIRLDPRPECLCGGGGKVYNLPCYDCACRWDRLHCSQCGAGMEPVTLVRFGEVERPRVCCTCIAESSEQNGVQE